MPRRALCSLLGLAAALVIGACGSSGGGGGGPGSDGGSSDAPLAPDRTVGDGGDGGGHEGGPADAGDGGAQDALPSDGSPTDGGAPDAGPTTYHDITMASFWSAFDVSTVNAGAKGFFGGTFDGRYVYLAPYSNVNGSFDGLVARYDTQASFTAGASWSTFDTSTVNGAAAGFEGALFDGRYVYFVPQYNGTSMDGVVARYDTQGAFTAAASWSTFDAGTVNDAGAGGFIGGTFDGRYAYFVPFGVNFLIDGIVARYDTTQSFGAVASWGSFDTSTLSTMSYVGGFAGGVYDGRFVYLAPNGGVNRDGIVTRYDTQAAFGSASAWSMFDTSTVNPAAVGFAGAAFDGRYVYLVPYNASFVDGGGIESGTVARYDTQASFTAGASWSTFDATTVSAGAKGFGGASFDGRYVYFVPNGYVPIDGLVARYDTQASFTAASSWSTFDTTTVNPGAAGFHGAVFDGRYLYLLPYGDVSRSGVVARFDAKTPPSMPNLPAFHGSFL